MPTAENPVLWTEMTKNARKMRVPLTILLELTPLCTLDCAMCYCHLTREQLGDRKIIPTEQWLRLIDEAYDMGLLCALLTGGECMLHPGFKEIYSHIRNKGIGVNINTNATLITDEMIDFLKISPPTRIQVTLYGTSEDAYERVTGHRVYQKVVDNIFKLKAAGFNVRIAVTASKYCFEDVHEIVRFARDNHFEYSLETSLTEADEGTGRSLDEYNLEIDKIVDYLKRIWEVEGRKLYDNEKITQIPKRMDDAAPRKSLVCGAARTTCAARWDGTMIPCFFTQDMSINFLEHSFAECWEYMGKCVDEQLVPVECITCELGPVCNVCDMKRTNPKDPGHRNPSCCVDTIAKYNAGLVTLKRDEK